VKTVFCLKGRVSIFLLLCILFSTGCKSTKNSVITKQEPEKPSTFQIVGATEVKIGTVAFFEVVNNTNSPVTINHPWQKRIEKFENNAWRRVKIISCPCGADCNAPPKTLVLNPKEKHKLDWNLKEGYCGKPEPNGIPATIENNSEPGLYRLMVDYGTGEKIQTIIKEFIIIK